MKKIKELIESGVVGKVETVQAMEQAMIGDTQKAKNYAKLLACQAKLLADLPLEDPAAYSDLVCSLMQ